MEKDQKQEEEEVIVNKNKGGNKMKEGMFAVLRKKPKKLMEIK